MSKRSHKEYIAFAFRVIAGVIAVLGVLALIIFTFSIIFRPAEYYAEKHWNEICEKINDGEVVSSRVILGYDGDVVINGADIDVENCLSAEDFVRCLSKNVSTPTPQYGVIEIKFSGESEVRFNNWGEYIFSIYYKKRYYEFKSEELFSRLQALYGSN